MENESLRQLLLELSDGQFHSGNELGKKMNLSRTSIWKQINQLEANGIEIYSIRGKGYRIPNGLDLLSWGKVEKHLLPEVASELIKVDLRLTTESTNKEAMQACQQSNAQGYLFLSEQQKSGRGRRGRTWVSPFGKNLYISLVWGFEQGICSMEGLSLMVGVAQVRALESLGIKGVQLKWPNDLLYNGKKLGGILIEINGETSGRSQVIIGMGLNVAMPESSSSIIEQPWIDIATISSEQPDRNQILAAILNQLILCLKEFKKLGFAAWVDEWHSLHAMQGKNVQLYVGKELIKGICLGVDVSGVLRLQTESGVKLFHGGEVSLRSAE